MQILLSFASALLRPWIVIVAASAALAACAGASGKSASTTFDFGLAPPPAAAKALPTALRVGETRGPDWLDNDALYYRLLYAQRQQTQPYANSRWVMSPLRLFDERLRNAVAARGQVVGYGDTLLPFLSVDIVEFSQVFDSPAASRGVVQVRASIFRGRALLAQQSFQVEQPAPTPDAQGGVQALAQASDRAIAQVLDWAAALPLAAAAK